MTATKNLVARDFDLSGLEGCGALASGSMDHIRPRGSWHRHRSIHSSTSQRLAREGALQRRSRWFHHAHYRATVVQRLWRAILPSRTWRVYRNVVPYDAVAIMFTHGMRYQSAFVPKLSRSDVGDPPQRRGGWR